MKAFYEILHVTEDEMREAMKQETPVTNIARIHDGVPIYYCITKAGTIQTWPRLNPEHMALYAWSDQ